MKIKPFTSVTSLLLPQSAVGECAIDSITIQNTTNEPMDLWTSIYASTPENSFTLSLMKPPSGDSDENSSKGFLEFFKLEDRMLQPNQTLTIWLSCEPEEIGLHTSIVHFDVADDMIEQVVFLLDEDMISHSLASNKPYSSGVKKKHFPLDNFVTCLCPARATRVQYYKNRLPRYDIPKDTKEMIERKQIPGAIMEGLIRENYALFFKTLLTMEEIQLKEDMRTHNMENVTMAKKGPYLSRVVSALAERRPSLVHGDYIIVKLADEFAGDITTP